jgi:hypothetical protein
VADITAGRGRSPLKALFASLVATFDTLLGAMSGDARRCLLITTWCRLPASLCWAKHGHLTAGGALGGDAMRLLKHAIEEVVMSALSRALRAVFGQHARTTLVSLATNLRFATSSLPLPCRGIGREVSTG